jgi:hypothetical protein
VLVNWLTGPRTYPPVQCSRALIQNPYTAVLNFAAFASSVMHKAVATCELGCSGLCRVELNILASPFV